MEELSQKFRQFQPSRLRWIFHQLSMMVNSRLKGLEEEEEEDVDCEC